MVDLLHNVLESSTEYSIIADDLDGLIVLWNEGARRIFGYSADEVIGKVNSAVLHTGEDLKAGRPQELRTVALREGKWEGSIERVRKSGQRFMALSVITPRFDADGHAAGFLFISKNISTEMELSRELTHAQNKFRALLEAAPDAIVAVDEGGQMVLVNSQTEILFGYSRSEILGQPIEILMPARFHAHHVGHRTGYFSEPRVRPMGASLSLFGIRKDGTEFPVEISLSPLQTEDGLLVTAAIRDVTERKRVEQALLEKNVELEMASQAKNRFLASMSHELRTPLNAIIGFTGTLLMKLAGPLTADQDSQLQTIRSSARHLLSLINDLLDLAKIESGKVVLNLEPVSCRAVMDEVAVSLAPQAAAKGLRFEVVIPDDDLVVPTDRRALQQIVLNLANNAIKFTEKGFVRLEVRRIALEPARVEVVITDSGIGISEEDQRKLFQAFEQARGGGRAHFEGSGLGLYLSQKLALLLGSEIVCHTEYGSGSRFSLVLQEETCAPEFW
jgi:protein-histidine pros-kinase